MKLSSSETDQIRILLVNTSPSPLLGRLPLVSEGPLEAGKDIREGGKIVEGDWNQLEDFVLAALTRTPGGLSMWNL